MAWISLFLASLCETLWASSLKFLNFRKIKIYWRRGGLASKNFGFALLPFSTYIFFGVMNMIFLTYSLKYIPLAICYAIWMGLALFIQTLIDIFYFRENIRPKQVAFMLLILMGIIGLQMSFEGGE